MCTGSRPSPPKIVYTGPSAADIQRGQDQLNEYRDQMNLQQSNFQTQLNAQIEQANQDTQDLLDSYAADSAAATAAGSAEVASAYTTSAQQSEIPEGAQTTAAVTDKKKPKRNLKISTAGTASSAGSGLNIGV